MNSCLIENRIDSDSEKCCSGALKSLDCCFTKLQDPECLAVGTGRSLSHHNLEYSLHMMLRAGSRDKIHSFSPVSTVFSVNPAFLLYFDNSWYRCRYVPFYQWLFAESYILPKSPGYSLMIDDCPIVCWSVRMCIERKFIQSIAILEKTKTLIFGQRLQPRQ